MIVELFIFLIGLCIGSFLNVVIYRYNTGWKITGRSKCLSCGKTLAWYELIPLFSFFFQGGRCTGCNSRLSWQYPLVEFTTGALFVGIYEIFGFTIGTPYYAIVWSLLVAIFVYDLKHKIIPDGLVFSFAFLSLFVNMLFVRIPSEAISLLVAGPAVAFPFLFIWLISKGKWMGFGDAKFGLAMGWMLGMNMGYAAITLAFWIGALIGILVMVFRLGNLHMKSEIPFAPFLVIGTAFVFFANIHIEDILMLFSFTR